MSEVNYPVQPFVFEFAREASKRINFNDITIRQAQYPDITPIKKYLETNQSFLSEYEQYNKPQAPEINTAQNCKINPIFFDPNFEISRKDIFEKVFPKGCLKQKIYGEELLLQLDAVQHHLFHSSDNHAFEFFKSFSTINEMHTELSVLLPRVKTMREELRQLDTVSQSPEQVAVLTQKSERLRKTLKILESMKKISNAEPAAMAYADGGQYKEAFDLVDQMLGLLNNGLLGVNVLKPYLSILKNAKASIGQKLIDSFKKLFESDTKGCHDIIQVLHDQKLIEQALEQTDEYLKQYAVSQVDKIVMNSASQMAPDITDINSLNLHDFSEVLQNAFPIIRLRILAKGTNTVEAIVSELESLGEETDQANDLLQTLCNTVYQEVTDILDKHPLTGVALTDFAQIFDSITAFGRGFDRCKIDDNLLRSSISKFGNNFINSYHASLMETLRISIDNDTWVKCDPNKDQLDILKKLTSVKNLDSLVISDEKFGCTSSLLTMLELIYAYFQAARMISNAAVDIAGKLCDAVQYYNTKTLELILKGQAFTKKILKNITTKHLSLSTANIEFLIKLMPLINIRFTAVSNTSNERTNFNIKQATEALKRHDTELTNKIVDVLNKAIGNHMDNAVVDDSNISPYVEKVAKEVNTLNNFLSDFLPEKTGEKIMQQIAYKIDEKFNRLMTATKDREKVIRDQEKLSSLLKSTKCKIQIRK